MMTLARVVTDYAHAVQRDLLCHRFRWDVFGLREHELLPFPRFVSFVMGAPSTSALGQAVAEGWTQTDELIANLTEQHAGLIHLTNRYRRPGVDPEMKKSDDDGSADGAGEQPEEPATSAAAARLAVSSGGTFDTFDDPLVFMEKLAAARAEDGYVRGDV